MELVASIEKPIAEFFGNVKAALRSLSVDGRAKWGGREHEFSGVLEATKEAVRAALADDFDTPVSHRHSHSMRALSKAGVACGSMAVAVPLLHHDFSFTPSLSLPLPHCLSVRLSLCLSLLLSCRRPWTPSAP